MQVFRLRDNTIALGFDDTGKKVAVMMPAGTHVSANGPVPTEHAKDRTEQIAVNWDHRTLTMFLVDLQDRGERVRSSGTSA
jgi:hypothetical protein